MELGLFFYGPLSKVFDLKFLPKVWKRSQKMQELQMIKSLYISFVMSYIFLFCLFDLEFRIFYCGSMSKVYEPNTVELWCTTALIYVDKAWFAILALDSKICL